MRRFLIRDARVPDEIPAVRALFEEYAASLDVDLCFQQFDEELAGLPGAYAPPRGCLLVGGDGDAFGGCIALRPLSDAAATRTAELKRLYVRPAARGGGLGRALAQAAIERARVAGYSEIKLDTLATMAEARTLYASLGFRECERYYDNPLEGVAYMALLLGARDQGPGIRG